MATYNGGKYLRAQLDSLLRQTEQRFTLIISDDGSTDSTQKIIEEYCGNYPEKIFFKHNGEPHGAKYNFLQLMAQYKDDYVMLCDQDDIWLDNKIEVTLHAMKKNEAKFNKTRPILVHTDLTVVDENLDLIAPSYKYLMNTDYNRTSLRHQIIQNTLTGCTAMYNRALAETLKCFPNFCVMHDWWLMLTASTFGIVDPLNESTILYRQHANNVMGARDMRSLGYMIERLLCDTEEIKKALRETYIQADSFLIEYQSVLSNEQKVFLKDYAAIPTKGKIGRMRKLSQLGIKKTGFWRQIAHYLFV